ncbi:MAG: site-specific integrase [Dysgonamonadaceae bacterium]|jgi:site-specific recombinase XerD|nr:site-specific integrase [Dysgonamonadaceae bacterium]
MNTSIKLKFISSKVKGKEGVICLQLIHNRKIKLMRTRFHLHPHEWKNPPEHIKTGMETELKQIVDLIRLLGMRGDYTVEELANLYANNSFNGYLFPFIDYIVKDLTNNNRRKTASICVTAKKSFERFLCGQDILLDNIDNDLMRKYESHLKTAGVMKNTISCYMRALRSVYNQAVKRGLAIQKNPFASIFTRIDKTVKRAVNEEVIIRLKTMDLSTHNELELTRDLFMFSFYMRGMSFVDMANLRKSNVKNDYIIYARSKTKQTLTVKIEDCMQEIITRYEQQAIDDYLLPIYTAQNRDNTSQLRNHNKRLKRISEMLKLEKPLSSYVSRHTWATLALRKGVPVEVISESMGHENETTTRIYLASLGQSVVDKANAEIIKLK